MHNNRMRTIVPASKRSTVSFKCSNFQKWDKPLHVTSYYSRDSACVARVQHTPNSTKRGIISIWRAWSKTSSTTRRLTNILMIGIISSVTTLNSSTLLVWIKLWINLTPRESKLLSAIMKLARSYHRNAMIYRLKARCLLTTSARICLIKSDHPSLSTQISKTWQKIIRASEKKERSN